MSGLVIPFVRPGQQGGLVYVVPGDETTVAPDWLVYSQPEDAAEPDLEFLHSELDDAIESGRQLATRRGARFVVDYGVMAGGLS